MGRLRVRSRGASRRSQRGHAAAGEVRKGAEPAQRNDNNSSDNSSQSISKSKSKSKSKSNSNSRSSSNHSGSNAEPALRRRRCT